jgi:YggT family protein
VGTFLAIFIRLFVLALSFILLARVLMSWVDPSFKGPVGRFVYETTEPFLAPIRRVLPPTGMIDLSPLVAFLILSVVLALVFR